MNKFWRLAPWLTRLMLVAPTVIFALIASRYLFDPVHTGATIGLAFNKPLSITITRVGFGAFPLACSIFTLSCLVSTRRILTGLGFVAMIMGVALVVRVVGMLVSFGCVCLRFAKEDAMAPHSARERWGCNRRTCCQWSLNCSARAIQQ
jgi:hypothetical protein